MEDGRLRLLLIHADKFEYEVRETAVRSPEPLDDSKKKGSIEDGLVVFCTVEKGDEQAPDRVISNASRSIEEVLDRLKAKKIMIYPYAHLSTDLASRDPALNILQGLERELASQGYEVKRSPFGWYKSFTIMAKGHPLSESSRTISVEEKETKAVTPMRTEYMIMDNEGSLSSPEDFVYKPGMEEFKSMVEKEALKKGLIGGEPKFVDYAKRFGLEWESYSDVGHMRFGPEASLILDILGEYANQVVRRIGIPILNVRGTNMFDVAVQPIKEHLQLFGSRAYEVVVDDRTFVLRYAACFQQFSMVRDWTLSYKTLPFGTLEIADSYRFEQSGELLISFRLRKFQMPDLHIYLKNLEESIEVGKKIHNTIYQEIRKLNREYVSLYNTTRSFFNEHKQMFKELVKVEKKPILLSFVPEGIYYWVLNVEYNIIDDLDRPREIGTFQIDVGNANRFGIAYDDDKGQKNHPVIIHTAVIGALERYLFTLLDSAVKMERQGRKPMLPVWVSPVQVRVVPLVQQFVEASEKVMEKLEAGGVRVDVDDREDTMQSRVREAELSWIPYILIYGAREAKSGKFSVRCREDGKERVFTLEELTREVNSKTQGYPHKELNLPKLLTQRPGYKRV